MRSSVAAVIAVMPALRAGICMIPAPSFIVWVLAPSQERTVTTSVPQALGGPGRVVAEPFRLDGELDQLGRVRARDA